MRASAATHGENSLKVDGHQGFRPLAVVPLKPRYKLFIILAGILLLWIIALLAMYFTTVYPKRHGSSAPVSRYSDQ